MHNAIEARAHLRKCTGFAEACKMSDWGHVKMREYGRIGMRVGISIVPLLVAISLVAAIGEGLTGGEKALEESRRSSCLSNLKKCAQAIKIYTDDYEACLPSSAVAHSNPTESDVVTFLTAKDVWPPKHTTKPVSWAQIIYPYLQSPDSVFCPSDAPRSRISYWWKYAVDLAWRDNNMRRRQIGDYAYDSSQVVLYEHAGWHVGDAAGITNGVMINVAYLDTHVKTVVIRNGPTSYPAITDERSGLAGVRLGEPMYFNYDTTTITRCSGVANYVDPARYCDSF